MTDVLGAEGQATASPFTSEEQAARRLPGPRRQGRQSSGFLQLLIGT